MTYNKTLTDASSSVQLVEVKSEQFKVIVNSDIQRKVNYLHNKYHGLEWGGFLFYTTNEAEKVQDLIITLVDFYPLDLGNSAFTSYTQTPEFAGFIADNPEYMNYNMGIIHSHHQMGAYHSSTDVQTLKDQVEHFRNFLSVVVDTRKTWNVKLAKYEKLEYKQSVRNIYSYSNRLLSMQTTGEDTITKEIAFVYDGTFEYAQWEEIPAYFKTIADTLTRNIAHDTDFFGKKISTPVQPAVKTPKNQSWNRKATTYENPFEVTDRLNQSANQYLQKDWKQPASLPATYTQQQFNFKPDKTEPDNGTSTQLITLKSFTDEEPIKISITGIKLLICMLSHPANISMDTINIDQNKWFHTWEKALYSIIMKYSVKYNSIETYIENSISYFYNSLSLTLKESDLMSFMDDLDWLIISCPERETNNTVSEALTTIYNSIDEYMSMIDGLEEEPDEMDYIDETIVNIDDSFEQQLLQEQKASDALVENYVNIADNLPNN